jgi:peptidoglycan-associated lipoprotein
MNRIATLLVISSLVFTGCKKKAPVVSGDLDIASTNTMATARPAPTQAERVDAATQLTANFARVNFALNSDELNEDSKAALMANAGILTRFPTLIVEIQGHADEQGTTDYNLALGQRRATSVSRYLQAQSVSASQLRTVSFGEERPAVMGHTESAFSANRRAEFRVIVPQAGVAGSVAE